MAKSKTKVEAGAKTAVAPTVQKMPETPEKVGGPSLAAKSGSSALPPPNGQPSAARAGEMMRSPEYGAGNMGRGRMMGGLQRSVGNARISRMMGPAVQTKLKVGKPNDRYEQEADRTADRVMTMPEPMRPGEQSGNYTSAPLGIQRLCPECKKALSGDKSASLCPECAKKMGQTRDSIQTQAEPGRTPEETPAVDSYINSSRGGGNPLPDTIRASMEPHFGQDFSGVRVHNDSQSANAAGALNAQAFTHGSDIYFNRGKYEPGSREGQRLLAHELTHTVQQNGAVNNSQSIQRSPNEGESEGFFGGLTSFGRSVAGGVQEVAGAGRRGFAALVRRVSPGLADLIARGPLTVLREIIERTARGWINGISNRLDLRAAIASIRTWLAGTFEAIESAASGDPKSCGALTQILGEILKLVRQVINHPAMVQLRAGMVRANVLMADVVSFFVESHIESIRLLWQGISGFSRRVSGWIRRAGAAIPGVLDWIAEQLGFSSDNESSILDRLKEFANRAWQSIKEDIAPAVLQGFIQTGRMLYELSGLKAINELIRAGRSFMTAAQWLWENRNDPNIVQRAKDDPAISQTILPRLLESARDFKGTIQSAFQWLVQKTSELTAGLLSLLGRITGLPILNIATSLVERAKAAVDNFRQWAQLNLTKAAQALGKAVSKIWKSIKPIVSVISLLILGAANPPMLPIILGILLGSFAWKQLPDCYKPPIIDFLLDLMIEVLESAPDVPMFGPLWSLLKPGLLALLVSVRTKSPAEKIQVTNKLADIMLESGIDFVLGYVWGFLKGIWESLTDPFMLLWMLGNGMISVVEWFGNIGERFFGRGREAHALVGTTATLGTQSTTVPSTEDVPESSSSTEQTSTESSIESPTEPQSVAPPPAGESEIDPLTRLQQMGEELRPPVNTVKDNFFSAAREYFSASGGATFDTLREKLGELWESAQETIAAKATEMADNVFNTLLGPQASEEGAESAFSVGEFIGWLTGTIVTEVLIAILSAGTVTAAKGAMKVIVAIAKVVDKIGDILGVALRLLRRLGRFLTKIVKGVAKMVGGATRGAFRLVTEALTTIVNKLRRFADEIFGMFSRRAGREAAGTGTGRATRGAAPDAPGTPGGRPRTQQDELLEQGASRELNDLTPNQLDAELDVVFRSQRQPSSVSGYVDEVQLPNGHTWRRRSDGRWCRFFNGGSCPQLYLREPDCHAQMAVGMDSREMVIGIQINPR